MSVPSWLRSTAKTQYINLLYQLNLKIARIVANGAKKYRKNYGDTLINSALKALQHAQIANSIYVSPKMAIEDYNLRRQHLQIARGTVENLATVSYIYLELSRNGADNTKIDKNEEYIGDTCANVHKMIGGVLKYDKSIIDKNK